MVIRWISRSVGIVILISGCKSPCEMRDPEFLQVQHSVHEAYHASAPAAIALSPVADSLAGPQPIDLLIRRALSQNAAVQAARKQVEILAMRVPQVSTLDDPMLDVIGWPIYPNVPQTASGRMTVDMMISQEVPWLRKLTTRAAVAEEEVNAARADLATTELRVVADVKDAYYELYSLQKSLQVMRQDQTVLNELIEVSTAMYTTGKTGQQDVLRLQAELANIDGELLRVEQMRESAQAELAQILHISPDTPLAANDDLSDDEIPTSLDHLYRYAIALRPELHVALAEIQRDQRRVELARLDYYPDATVKFGWGEMTTNRAIAPTADGIDNLTLGLSMNLPIYRTRLNAAVHEAESAVVASARKYDQLKDETQGEVKRLFTLAKSQSEIETLLRKSVIPKTEQALEIAVQGYQVGETEFADVISNWRELLRYHVSQIQLEAQTHQTIATLERIVGGMAGLGSDETSHANSTPPNTPASDLPDPMP